MAATDSTLQINITTTADLSGVKEVQNAIDGATQSVKQTQEAAAGLPRSFELTRYEAAALSREIADGVVSARGLGTALSALGNPVAIIGIGVFTLVKMLSDAHAAAVKVTEEFEAQSRELLNTSRSLQDLAKAATTEQDLANMARTFTTELQTQTDKLQALTRQAADASGWERFRIALGGVITDVFTLQSQWNDYGNATDKAAIAQQDYLNKLILTQQNVERNAEANVRYAQSLPVTTAEIMKLNLQLDDLKIASLAAADAGDNPRWIELQKKMADLRAVIALVTGEWNKLNEAAKKFQEEQSRIEKEGEQKAKVAEQQELNAALRQGSEILERIRQQQELIKANPFMGADAKQVAMIQQYRAEMDAIVAQMQKLQAMKVGITDPAELERINAETQKLRFTWQQLSLELQGALRPLQSELQTWVNGFGTTMHQLATTIEDTVGTALQGVNQWIVTGKFNLQSMMQSIELLGLKLVEQLILQRVMSAVNAQAAATTAAVTGPQIAAALAPAATAATVASFGSAAIAAPAEFATALFAIQAMSVAHEGGEVGRLKRLHDGGLAPDERLIVAETGEIMMRRSVADKYGDFLLSLNAGLIGHAGGIIPTFQTGGMVTTGFGESTGISIEPTPIPQWGAYTGGGNYQVSPTLYPTDTGGGGPIVQIWTDPSGSGIPPLIAPPPMPYINGPAPSVSPSAGFVSATTPTVYTPMGGSTGIFAPLFGGVFSGHGAGPQFSSSGPQMSWSGSSGLIADALAMMVSGGGGLGLRGAAVAEQTGTAFDQAMMRWIAHGGTEDSFYAAMANAPVSFPRHTGITAASAASAFRAFTSGGFHQKAGTSKGGIFHAGGGPIGGGGVRGSGRLGGDVHVYAFTDLKALTKHMGSRDGKKVIFDTVRGNKIRLGMR
jgi:hypothetical protein